MVRAVPFNDLARQTRDLEAPLLQAAARVIKGGWYVQGAAHRAFESAFADYCGTRHAVAVANGTDALEIALRALDLKPGQRVATVANAGGYVTGALLALGAVPVFVDVTLDSQLMDLHDVERVLQSQSIHAVVATHLYGRMLDMERLIALCAPFGIPVVEDCAQAHGARSQGRLAGSFGTVGCFSFYPTKNLGALGDGGAIVMQDDTIAAKARSLRQYGWAAKYVIADAGGRNSRLDELQAALLLEKLPHLDRWNDQRRSLAARYSRGISNSRVHCPTSTDESWVAHLYVIRCEARDALRLHLKQAEVGCDVHYPVPDHQQPAWQGLFAHRRDLPVTEALAAQVLSLPCYPELTDEEADRVIAVINGW